MKSQQKNEASENGKNTKTTHHSLHAREITMPHSLARVLPTGPPLGPWEARTGAPRQDGVRGDPGIAQVNAPHSQASDGP